MKRYASVRFGDALDADGRERAARLLGSAGATATSWQTTAQRTYVRVELDDGGSDLAGPAASSLAARLSECFPGTRLDSPPLMILRVRVAQQQTLARLLHALGGNGRPAGIVDVVTDEDALVVELDAQRTPLHFILTLLDVELAAPARSIEPLLAPDDAALTAFAADVLSLNDLDESRIIETHLAAFLDTVPCARIPLEGST